MSQTLHSKLKVLIAQAYKAEKLYGSMRLEHRLLLESEDGISKLANDIRAKQWQRTHFVLRQTLNDLLSNVTSSAELLKAVASLRDKFAKKSLESENTLELKRYELQNACERDEFAHSANVSLELINLKAKSQALRGVADELDSLLKSISGARYKKNPEQDFQSDFIDEEGQFVSSQENAGTGTLGAFPFGSDFQKEPAIKKSNVVELKFNKK